MSMEGGALPLAINEARKVLAAVKSYEVAVAARERRERGASDRAHLAYLEIVRLVHGDYSERKGSMLNPVDIASLAPPDPNQTDLLASVEVAESDIERARRFAGTTPPEAA